LGLTAKGRYQKIENIPGESKITLLKKLILFGTNTERDLKK